MNTIDFCGIAKAGGNITIDAREFNALQLKNIASSGVVTGAQLTIKNAFILNSLQCKQIASANPGKVNFCFC